MKQNFMMIHKAIDNMCCHLLTTHLTSDSGHVTQARDEREARENLRHPGSLHLETLDRPVALDRVQYTARTMLRLRNSSKRCSLSPFIMIQNVTL